MIAKKLRHRVTLQRKSMSNDGFNTITWQDYKKSIASNVSFLSGRDVILSNAEHSAVVARIQVRYDKDITPDMRVLFRDDAYKISAILPDNESGLQWLTLLVEKGVVDGD